MQTDSVTEGEFLPVLTPRAKGYGGRMGVQRSTKAKTISEKSKNCSLQKDSSPCVQVEL